jgi:hypothetical protein
LVRDDRSNTSYIFIRDMAAGVTSSVSLDVQGEDRTT